MVYIIIMKLFVLSNKGKNSPSRYVISSSNLYPGEGDVCHDI